MIDSSSQIDQSLDYSNLLKVYFFSVFILVSFLLLLYAAPASRVSLSMPDGSVPGNPWIGSDVMTYIQPAHTFLQKGEFLRKGLPDLHRTIGYPLFLAVVMKIFGQYWLLAVYIVQIAIFSMLFPAVIIIYRTFYPGNTIKPKIIVGILLSCGIGCAYVGQILTDQLFTALLIVGFSVGCISIRMKSWKFAILHVVIISYAAQIRPTLSLFWIADLCFLLYIARQYSLQGDKKVKYIIVLSVLMLAVSGNGPAIRNNINHGIFTPTDILSNNLAYYLAGPVLIAADETPEYEQKVKEFKQLNNIERIKAQKDFAVTVAINYPLATIKRVVYHGFWNMFEPHWEYILFVYGSGFGLNSIFDEDGSLNPHIFLGIPFFIYYLLVYLLILLALGLIIKQKKWLLLFGLFFFLLPFAASLINGQGARMRLFAEPLILLIAMGEISQIKVYSRYT